jgi:IPT/TIG domain
VRRILTLAACALAALGPARAAFAAAPQVLTELRHDTGPALTTLPLVRGATGAIDLPAYAVPNGASASTDPAVQHGAGGAMPAPLVTFPGIDGSDLENPPAPTGDVGPNDYVQWVNGSIAVFDKTGAVRFGPTHANLIWKGFSNTDDPNDPANLCESINEPDPTVRYDPLADRWLLSHLAFNIGIFGAISGPFVQCLAVSAGSDPAGAYHRYAFEISATDMDAGARFGVWPDGYYMSFDQLHHDPCPCPPGGWRFVGEGAVVFDRTAMLAGNAATAQLFATGDTALGGMLPADLDGSTPPPPGSPEIFARVDASPFQLELWHFHTDWTTPASSTFTLAQTVGVAPWINSSPGLEEPSPGAFLQPTGDRLMDRLAYRNLGTREALVADHNVGGSPSGRAAPRWYELQRTSGLWGMRGQGTYAPNGAGRGSSSAAMDRQGDLALGYTISSSTIFPSLAYTGRLANDPPNRLRSERALFVGSGVQQPFTNSSWGPFSMMSVDPSDDCTFWYENVYYAAGASRWSSRIGSFRFPSCLSVTGFAPATGPVGTIVTITGTGFAAVSSVKFNGKPAPFLRDSATQLRARVPVGATSGPISVTTGAGTATSASSFTVSP